MKKKILLVDHYSKIGKENLAVLLTELGFMVDKLFKTDFEELKGILTRGNYNFLFMNLTGMKSQAVVMAERLRQELNELPIIGLVGEKNNGSYKGFTTTLKQPVDFQELKKVLGLDFINES